VHRCGHVDSRQASHAGRSRRRSCVAPLTQGGLRHGDGIETITIIRERFPDVKIFAVSGGGQRNALDYLPSAKALGAHETLAKPFGPNELYSAVAAALAGD
jgi:DNA-binding NarL/FixJ family response regulator